MPRVRPPRVLVAGALAVSLVAGGCSGDDEGGASDDATPPPTPSVAATTPEPTPPPASVPTPTAVNGGPDEVTCVEGLAPTDAPPPPEVTEATRVATIDTDVWGGELPRDEDLVVAGATMLGVVDGVAARVDLSSGDAFTVDVPAVDGASGLVGASFTAPGSWWLTLAREAAGEFVVIEVDATTGCEISRFSSDTALEPILVDGANLWAAETGSGDLHLRSYPDGEPLDVFPENVANWEITTTIGGDLAQIGFCGQVSAVPGDGVDAPYEGRLGDGDEQCGERWGVDGDVIVMADDVGDAGDPARGWWFDMSGVTIGNFALPFDIVHVDPDVLGAWVVAADGDLWRLPTPSTRDVGIVQGCLQAPVSAGVPPVPPGEIVELADAGDPGAIAASRTLLGVIVTFDGETLGWVDPVDGATGTWEIGIPLSGAEVVAPDGLWMVTRSGDVTQLLGVDGGCIDDVVTTGVVATDVVTVTSDAVWVRTADDIVAVDRTTGLVVDDLAAILARSTLSADDVSLLPADVAATGALTGVTDREGSGFVLTGECGISVAVEVTGDNAAVFDPRRCDLEGFVPPATGDLVGWTPDGPGGSVVAVVTGDADGVTGAEEFTVSAEVVSGVVGDDVVYLVAADGTSYVVRAGGS